MKNRDNSSLIQKLLNCVLACEHCATSCLREEDVTAMAPCILLDRDCSDICTLAARLLKRESDIDYQYLIICEEICRKCAAECGQHEHEHCKECAIACTACADACHENHVPVTQD